MDVQGGVLVIGSLYWGNGKREAWRMSRLNKSKGIHVRVPIRYGRLSREGRYTMVFSPSLRKEDWGTSYVIPFKHKTSSFSDLLKEADELACAEGLGAGLVRDWGTVAILPNRSSKRIDSILSNWERMIRDKLSGHPLLTAWPGERPTINEKGILLIPWPLQISPSQSIADLDFLLATATVPKHADPAIARYPTPKEIALQVDDYFINDRASGIVTFQDDEILLNHGEIRD